MVRAGMFFLFLGMISCGIKTRLLDDKITNVPIDNSIFKNKILFDKQVLTKIDTNAIYQEEYVYFSNKNDFKNIDNTKYNRTDHWKGYYKFYSNGCVNYFSFQDAAEIAPFNLNSNFKGQRGVLYDKKNEVRLDLFTITGYSFKRDYGIITHIVRIKGDTLFVKNIKAAETVNVYVKKTLPKEFLINKPDW